MPFLKSFSINTDKKHPFPFNVTAVRYAKNIQLDNKVTIFIGDNGTGKSTLLESLCVYLQLPLIGGHITGQRGFEAASILKPFVEVEWKRQTAKGFFFRAEDFSDFINSPENARQRVLAQLKDLEGKVDGAIIEQMAESANISLRQMRKDYGENMQAFSHGEAFLKILQTRIGEKGIFLLDEPEAALSPLRQLSLLYFILEILKNNNTQFIISTHSPILMGIPGALIYEIKEDGMKAVDYTTTDHYVITKTFLTNPEFYLKEE